MLSELPLGGYSDLAEKADGCAGAWRGRSRGGMTWQFVATATATATDTAEIISLSSSTLLELVVER